MIDRLPSELMMGGFGNSGESLVLAMEHFGIPSDRHNRPRIYYPGSSYDASLAVLDTVEVVHCDPQLTEAEIVAFEALGSRAFAEDAEIWNPDGVFDAVVFINGSGIDELKVMDNVSLRVGGLALWAMWGDSKPDNLSSMNELELVAVTTASLDERGNLNTCLETNNPQHYIDNQEYANLTPDQLVEFRAALARFFEKTGLEMSENAREEDAYYELAMPHNQLQMFILGYAFPRKKSGATFYIFQKQK